MFHSSVLNQLHTQVVTLDLHELACQLKPADEKGPIGFCSIDENGIVPST
jgi:hypothetical protein